MSVTRVYLQLLSDPAGRLDIVPTHAGPPAESQPAKQTGTTNRNVRVADALWKPAQKIADRRGETLSEVMRRTLREYVDAHGIPSDFEDN